MVRPPIPLGYKGWCRVCGEPLATEGLFTNAYFFFSQYYGTVVRPFMVCKKCLDKLNSVPDFKGYVKIPTPFQVPEDDMP